MTEVSDLIIKYSFLPVLITAVYALVIYKGLPRELKIFCWYVFLSAIVELSSAYLWFQSINNLWLLHFYIGIGSFILASFYNSVFRGFINSRVIWVTTILFSVFVTLNAVFFQGIFTYASYSQTVQSILIIILSLSTFIFLLDDIVKESKVHLLKSLNWINSGLFIYYSSGLLLFYFAELVIDIYSKNANIYIWTGHVIFLLVMNFCFFIGLWFRPKS